jgi:hypothetical protein
MKDLVFRKTGIGNDNMAMIQRRGFCAHSNGSAGSSREAHKLLVLTQR